MVRSGFSRTDVQGVYDEVKKQCREVTWGALALLLDCVMRDRLEVWYSAVKEGSVSELST
jgi:hypothetical protein